MWNVLYQVKRFECCLQHLPNYDIYRKHRLLVMHDMDFHPVSVEESLAARECSEGCVFGLLDEDYVK